MSAAHSCTTLTSDGVDLVDENDARAVLLGLLEHVAHPGGTDAHEHLYEVRAGDREERHTGLTGDRAGQQRLAGTGRTEEQHPLGDLGAQGLIPGRVLQEVLDFVELLDRLVHTGDIGERGLGHVLGELLGLRLTEAESHPPAGLHAGEHHEQPDEQQQRQHVDQQRADHAALVDDGVDLRALGAQRFEQLDPESGGVLGDDLVAVLGVAVAVLQVEPQLLFAVVDLRARDVVALDLGHRHRGVDRLEPSSVVAEVEERPPEQQHHGDHRERADHSLAVHTSMRFIDTYGRWRDNGQILPIRAQLEQPRLPLHQRVAVPGVSLLTKLSSAEKID